MTEIVIVFSLAATSAGSLLVWRSRWNVPALIDVGFIVTAFVIPVLILHVPDAFPSVYVHRYVLILAVGAVAYLVGIFLGSAAPVERMLRSRFAAAAASRPGFERVVAHRTGWILFWALVGLGTSLLVMGFVPAFATDPFAAKYFRPPYLESYQRVAILYRVSFFALATVIPAGLAAWSVTRRRAFLWASLAGGVLIALMLVRGLAVQGLLLYLGLVAAHRRRVGLFLLLVLVAFPLGSAAWYLLSKVASSFGLFAAPGSTSVWEAIHSGAPDVSAHIQTLMAFEAHGELTLGRTFWGGLVPWHYQWNPSVWSLAIFNPGAPPAEQSIGGLRLPMAMWGYVSFGWPGVALVPFVSGLIWGNATAFARRHVGQGSILTSAVILVLYTTVGYQVATFYLLSLYNLPAIVVALTLAHVGRRRVLRAPTPPVARSNLGPEESLAGPHRL